MLVNQSGLMSFMEWMALPPDAATHVFNRACEWADAQARAAGH